MTRYFGTDFAEEIIYEQEIIDNVEAQLQQIEINRLPIVHQEEDLDAELNNDEPLLEKIAFAVSEAYRRAIQSADEEHHQAIVCWTKHNLRLKPHVHGNREVLDNCLTQSLQDTIEMFLELDHDFQGSVINLIQSKVFDIDDVWPFLLELIMQLRIPENVE